MFCDITSFDCIMIGQGDVIIFMVDHSVFLIRLIKISHKKIKMDL